jgi:two-component system response regulator AtoC
MNAKSILIVDDEPQVGMMLSLHLRGLGLEVLTVESGRQAWRALSENVFDCVLTDLVMPDGDGFWLLEQIATLPRPPIALIMSGHADAEVAIRALDQGAYDYVPKPFRPEEVIFRIRRALERVEMAQELERLRLERKQFEVVDSGIITRSKLMQDLLGIVKRVAPFKTTVLITGESGTGKELVARALHDNGDRSDRAFVAVNCGAIPEHLLESELFGHKKGAFTDAVTSRKGLFEEADGGTLFLDEVGELPLQVQVKLLRVLQEGKIRRVGESVPVSVDVRIVAATVRDLKAAVQEKRFREDLFYRLNVMPIELPPLRARTEDIPLLIEHFLNIHRRDDRTSLSSVRRDAMADLLEYRWPGNVRELQNVVERIVILTEGDELTRQALPAHFHAEKPSQTAIVRGAGLVSSPDKSLKQALQGVEKDLIACALQQTDGNRTRAARLLEISHRSLLYKIKSYGIE